MRMYFTVSQYKKLQQSLWSNAIFQKENLTMYPCADIRFRITRILEKYMSD